jgi:hypothetical protein
MVLEDMVESADRLERLGAPTALASGVRGVSRGGPL